MTEKKTVPMKNDNGSPLFTWPAEKPQLIGCKCKTCGEIVFPKQVQCPKCFTETMEETLLSTKGKVYSSTISHLAPGTMFHGEVPYALGYVELPERVLVSCRFALTEEPLPIGTEVELAIREWGEDEEGNTLMMHSFEPVK